MRKGNIYYVTSRVPRHRNHLRKDASGSPYIYVTPNKELARHKARSLKMHVYRLEFIFVPPRKPTCEKRKAA